MLKSLALAGALGAPLPLPLDVLPLDAGLSGSFELPAPLDAPPALPLAASPLAAASDGEDLVQTSARHRPALAAALELARATPTGSRVLAAFAERGAPVRVRVRELGGDLGAYDYLEGSIELDTEVLAEPARAAATLVHELIHVLQHDEGIPAEALEMELEAHVLTLDILAELGQPIRGFSAGFQEALGRGPAATADWLEERLPGKTRWLGRGPESALAQLRSDVEDLAEAQDLRWTARGQERLSRAKRDLRRMRTPAGRGAYGLFVKRVEALLLSRARN